MEEQTSKSDDSSKMSIEKSKKINDLLNKGDINGI